MGTAERRYELLKILCRRRYETLQNLASVFGVSTRTIQRDIEVLSSTEPIYTQCGRYGGGVYVVEGYSVDRVYMTDSELHVLKKLYESANRSICALTNEETDLLRAGSRNTPNRNQNNERIFAMNEKEKQLFKALCRFRDPISDTALTEFATPAVLGHLFFNRMSGIAYGTLRCNGLLGKVNREFRSSLSAAWEQNVQKNESFRKCVAFLSGLLASSDCKVAMLKGALLCARYPDGYRTSNDVDLLVSPSDVTKIGHLLSSAGFRQGNVRNGAFIPATREQVIESRMMRGETVPYVLEVNLPFMKFLEVDVNFSLDYKNGSETALTKMLSAACRKDENGISVPTLDDKDFFLHLCAHLYKEATTLPWIEMHRDMTLYKYCDLYLLLSEMTDPQLRQIFERAGELGMEKVCAYAILETMGLFDMDHPFARHIAGVALGDDPDFCRKVVSPKDKKLLMYRTADVTERFFLEAREKDLAEVSGNEST